MYYIQLTFYIILLLCFAFSNNQSKDEIEQLIEKFRVEKNLSNYESADKLAKQIISELELEPNLEKENFANYLLAFADFYFEIKKDSIANILYFRSAKIYESEILRFQSKLINPLIGLDNIYIASNDTFSESPYSMIIKELNDSLRMNYNDTSFFHPYGAWFPEIRYVGVLNDTSPKLDETNVEAIELTNIALSYYDRGLFKDAAELLSQAIVLDEIFLNHEFLTNQLFLNKDSTNSFINEISNLDSISQLSTEKKFILGLANLSQDNYEKAYNLIKGFQLNYPNELRLDLLLGDIHFGMKNWFESLIYYHNAIQKSPKNIHAKIGFSLSMMHRGDFQGARIVLEQIILNKILDYRVYLALGKIYAMEQKNILAIKQLKKALELHKQNAEIHFHLGKVFLKIGKLSQALDFFTKSTIYEKENGEYHYYLGQVYEKILKLDEAIKNYKITRKFSPENIEVNRKLGLLLFNKKQYRNAVEPLRNYIINFPDSTRILSIFSNVLLQESRYPEAIDGFSRLIEKEPNDIDNYLKLADAYKQMDYFQEAMYVYEKALNFNDELSKIYNELALTTYELGYYEKTIKYLLESMNCENPDFNTNYLLGLAYGNLGKSFQAILAFNQAKILNPQDKKISFQTGVLLMELLLFEDALTKFNLYANQYPDDALVHFLIGKCLYKLGEYESAITSFQKALIFDNQDADSQYYIGLCLKQIGNLDNAAIALKKATLLNPDEEIYHFEIGQLYLAIGKLRLAYNEANILKLIGSTYFDTLNSLIEYNNAEKDSSLEQINNLD